MVSNYIMDTRRACRYVIGMGHVKSTGVPRLEINEAIRQRFEFIRVLQRERRLERCPSVALFLSRVIEGGYQRITYIRNLQAQGATHFP